MLGSAHVVLLGAAPAGGAANLALIGAWPLDEASGTSFADGVGDNTATLAVPAWTMATHATDRRSIVAGQVSSGYDLDHTRVGGGGVGSLEVSNGGPAIPMIPAYQLSAVSFVIYACPLGELRGTQYWDPSSHRYGSEIVAGSFSLASPAPGDWLIERKWSDAWGEHRWGVQVHDGTTWHGAGYGAAHTATVDAAARLALTFGPAGAQFWIGDSLAGTVSQYTAGWASLDQPITLGCDPDFDHANDRRPFWGRLDEVAVWSGQLPLAAVQALPAAQDSPLWKYPADFGTANDRRVQDFGSVQAAMDAAASAGGYLYQDEADATVYGLTNTSGDCGLHFKAGALGLVGLRLKWNDLEAAAEFRRLVFVGNADGGQMGTPVGGRTYRFVGLDLDGNARGQDWHPKFGEPGYTATGFDYQQSHLLRFITAPGSAIDAEVDACTFADVTGDGVSHYGEDVDVTTTSSRFYGCFRGALVINSGNVVMTARRCEMFADSRKTGGTINGTGLQDVEPFDSDSSLYTVDLRDCWSEGDFDHEGENPGSSALYVNVHITKAGFYVLPVDADTLSPMDTLKVSYATLGYHHSGGNGTGNWPPAWGRGWTTNDGLGVQFDHVIFVANGDTYYYHSDHEVTPTNAQTFDIEVRSGTLNGPRMATLTSCEFRVKNLPTGATVRAFSLAGYTTAQSLELDGVRVDAAFAPDAFLMGGVTVRHRDVLHEGTLSTTPWSGPGSVVAL